MADGRAIRVFGLRRQRARCQAARHDRDAQTPSSQLLHRHRKASFGADDRSTRESGGINFERRAF
jgi:hypothetical protein